MKIVCDRCKKNIIDFARRHKWLQLETSEMGYGKLGDMFLCPECKSEFYKFIDGLKTKEIYGDD